MTTLRELAENLRHKLYENPTSATVEAVVREINSYKLTSTQKELLLEIMGEMKLESSNSSFEDCIKSVETKIKGGKS